jgi:hypothetical protein
MGIGEWFKRTFGKQPCAFCGTEVGMMKRTKIKNQAFICNDCRRTCSQHIDVYRYTKDELLEHMEYMKRQERLYASLGEPTRIVPGSGSRQAIEFYDNHGMFRIRDLDTDGRYPKELIRYDQVAGYEPFCRENEPEEQGKPKTFEECGVIISFVGERIDTEQEKKGLRSHPYILRDLEVVVNTRDKHVGMLDVKHIISIFDGIFGVNDDRKGLFSFGPTAQERRQGAAAVAMAGMFGAAVQAARTGEISDEDAAKVTEAMNKVADAATSGLAKYTRLADEAEANIQ